MNKGGRREGAGRPKLDSSIAKYIRDRNALVPIAEAYTDEAVGKRPKPANGKRRTMVEDAALNEWFNKWNLVFNGKMEELVSEHRLRTTEVGT
jgi:hypothetical protein